MTNHDYLNTLSKEKFASFLCGMSGTLNDTSLQIMISWLDKDVDDEFFSSQSEKKEYVDMFNQYKREFDIFFITAQQKS